MKRLKAKVDTSLESRYAKVLSVLLCLPFVAFLLDQHVHTWSPSWKMLPLDLYINLVNPIGYGVTLLIVTLALGALGWCAKRPRLCQAATFASWTFIVAGLIEFALKH